jgi:hypothetical protein
MPSPPPDRHFMYSAAVMLACASSLWPNSLSVTLSLTSTKNAAENRGCLDTCRSAVVNVCVCVCMYVCVCIYAYVCPRTTYLGMTIMPWCAYMHTTLACCAHEGYEAFGLPRPFRVNMYPLVPRALCPTHTYTPASLDPPSPITLLILHACIHTHECMQLHMQYMECAKHINTLKAWSFH